MDREEKEKERPRERKTEAAHCHWRLEHRATLVHQPERRREVCGATILIRRWIYGLNHRRIISDSRALLPPTETYACLFADNCTRLRARPLFLVVSLSLHSASLSSSSSRRLFGAFLSVLLLDMTFSDLLSGISMTLYAEF